MKPFFSIEESLEFGWKKTREHSALLLQSMCIFFIVTFFNALLSKSIVQNTALDTALYLGFGSAMTFLVLIILSVGFLVLLLKVVRGQKATLYDLIPTWNTFVRCVAANAFFGFFLFLGLVIATLVATIAGAALIGSPLILVASAILYGISLVSVIIYACIRFSFLRFVAVDGERNITLILQRSMDLTRDMAGKLLLFSFVLVVFNVIGFLCLVVGLLITIPVSLLALAHVYVQLSEKAR